MGQLATMSDFIGDPRHRDLMLESIAMLEPLGVTPQLATALRKLATKDVAASRFEEALAGFERARELGRDCTFANEREALRFRGTLMGWRGIARAVQGDRAGDAETEEAIAMVTAAGDGQAVMSLRINLAIARGNYANLSDVLASMEDAFTFGQARGMKGDLAWLEVGIVQARYELGDLGRMRDDARDLDQRLSEQGAVAIQLDLRVALLRVDILQGIDPGAERLAWLEHTARQTEAPESLTARAGRGQRNACHARGWRGCTPPDG